MRFQPSQFSRHEGISGTSTDQWIRNIYAPPKAEDDEPQANPKADEPQVLVAPSPWSTVALVSTKQGLDAFGQMEVETSPTPKAVEIVIAVGHVALGVGLFGALLWGMTTIGAAISGHATLKTAKSSIGAGGVSPAPSPVQGR